MTEWLFFWSILYTHDKLNWTGQFLNVIKGNITHVWCGVCMCMNLYICVCVLLSAYVCAYVCLWIYVSKCVCIYGHVYIYIYIYIYKYICICVCGCVYVCMCVRMCMKLACQYMSNVWMNVINAASKSLLWSLIRLIDSILDVNWFILNTD